MFLLHSTYELGEVSFISKIINNSEPHYPHNWKSLWSWLLPNTGVCCWNRKLLVKLQGYIAHKTHDIMYSLIVALIYYIGTLW